MTLREFIQKIKKFMPEATESEAVSFFNDAYNDLISQDVSDWLFMNQSDYRFPYPILYYKNPLPADPGEPAADEGVDDWYNDWDNSEMTSLSYDVNTNFLVDTNIQALDFKLYDNISITDQSSQNSIVVKPRKVANVFTFKTTDSFNDFRDIFRPKNIEGSMYSKYEFVKVPFKTEPADVFKESPRITFFYAPKKLNQPYFVEFYYKPVQALSINSPVLIDLNKWYSALKDGTVGYYEDIVQGNSSKLQLFMDKWIKKYKNEANSSLDDRESTRFPTRCV